MNLAADEEPYRDAQTCPACRCSFFRPGPFQNHLRWCKPAKECLWNTLTAAKDAIARKRQRRDEDANLRLSEDVIDEVGLSFQPSESAILNRFGTWFSQS